MAFIITDDCISCGVCAAECPVEAISEGASRYVIDESLCIDCGACAAACPVGAIEVKYDSGAVGQSIDNIGLLVQVR